MDSGQKRPSQRCFSYSFFWDASVRAILRQLCVLTCRFCQFVGHNPNKPIKTRVLSSTAAHRKYNQFVSVMFVSTSCMYFPISFLAQRQRTTTHRSEFLQICAVCGCYFPCVADTNACRVVVVLFFRCLPLLFSRKTTADCVTSSSDHFKFNQSQSRRRQQTYRIRWHIEKIYIMHTHAKIEKKNNHRINVSAYMTLM